ncbi:MAG: PEP-CTERM sorting domain-containing protein [Pseudomonadota bacterium]
MKTLLHALALAICAALPTPAAAALDYDPATGILTDTEAQRMWLLHGIGFGSSYGFPGFAIDWVAGLNLEKVGGYSDWALPSVEAPPDGSPPAAMGGDLGQLFVDLSTALADRSQWPFGLGAEDYGGRIIYTDDPVPGTANYWGLSFGNGAYVAVYPGNAYAYVGVMAVRPVPEAETWAMLLAGLGLIGLRLARTQETRID